MDKQELNKKIAGWLFPPPLYRVGDVYLGIHGRFGHIHIEMLYTQKAKDWINNREAGLGDVKEVGKWYFWETLPIFTESFDACLERLVPKLQDEGCQIDIVCFEHKGFAVSPFYVLGDQTRPLIDVRDDSLPLALCLAVEKLIDGNLAGAK